VKNWILIKTLKHEWQIAVYSTEQTTTIDSKYTDTPAVQYEYLVNLVPPQLRIPIHKLHMEKTCIGEGTLDRFILRLNSDKYLTIFFSYR
jgi:hypothetical protein